MVREHGVDARVPMCLRVLLSVNTPRSQAEIRHVYARGAAELRPDLTHASAEATYSGTDRAPQRVRR